MTMIRLTLRSRGGVFLAAAVLLVCQSCAEKAKEDASRVIQAKPLEESASTDSTASVGSNAEQGKPIREQILTMTPQAAEQLRIMRRKTAS